MRWSKSKQGAKTTNDGDSVTAAAAVHEQIDLVGSDQGRPLQIVGLFALAVASIGLLTGTLLPALAIASLLSFGGIVIGAEGHPLTTAQSLWLGTVHLAALFAFVLF